MADEKSMKDIFLVVVGVALIIGGLFGDGVLAWLGVFGGGACVGIGGVNLMGFE